jgi:hypothetical protein
MSYVTRAAPATVDEKMQADFSSIDAMLADYDFDDFGPSANGTKPAAVVAPVLAAAPVKVHDDVTPEHVSSPSPPTIVSGACVCACVMIDCVMTWHSLT